MKKLMLMAVIALGVSVAANAQPRAIGARLGWGFEASYQHTVKNADFVELDLGLFTHSVNLNAIYDFMIAQPNWTSRGEWGFYAGPGASIGFGVLGDDDGNFNIAVAGQVGLEYTFWFPLQLSFDIKAQLGGGLGHDPGFYWGVGPALSVRYRF